MVADFSATDGISLYEFVAPTPQHARASTVRARLVAAVGGGGGVGNGGVTPVNFRSACADLDDRRAHEQSEAQHAN